MLHHDDWLALLKTQTQGSVTNYCSHPCRMSSVPTTYIAYVSQVPSTYLPSVLGSSLSQHLDHISLQDNVEKLQKLEALKNPHFYSNSHKLTHVADLERKI